MSTGTKSRITLKTTVDTFTISWTNIDGKQVDALLSQEMLCSLPPSDAKSVLEEHLKSSMIYFGHFTLEGDVKLSERAYFETLISTILNPHTLTL